MEDRPRWVRPSLFVVAALSALCYTWNLGRSQYNGYFAMAVRSMTASPKAFLYGTVDPAASITIDKLPGFLWPQALSALVFGFHPWALALPQVIEGVVSVLALYIAVRRWAGPIAGLLASALFAITPIIAVMFGHTTMEDPALTMCLILAAACWQKAADAARLRPLLLAGGWVGIGFQAKMLQAWAVLPAFAVGYLLAAPAALRTRLRHLAIAGAVTLAVSVSWILVATLTPAADRPYIDGTTGNSAVVMVVGYNGIGRFGTFHVPGALGGSAPPGSGTAGVAAGALPPGVPPQVMELLEQTAGSGRTGWGKLFGADLGTQIGWLYPFALLALVSGLVGRRIRSGYLMWGTWLVVTGLAFSAGEVAHASYMAALAAPLAALTGAGIVDLWRAYRAGGRAAWLLPVAVAAETAWTVYLLAQRHSFLPWLLPAVVVLAVAGIGALLLRGRFAPAGLAAGLAAMLVAPVAWSVSTVDSRYSGTVLDAYAGPAGHATPFIRQPDTLTPDQERILAYATEHRGGAKYLFATDSWTAASPYVLATGAEILPLGGFSGAAPFPTLEQFQHLVATGQVHQVLLSNLRGAQRATSAAAITGWVRQHCAPVARPLYSCSA